MLELEKAAHRIALGYPPDEPVSIAELRAYRRYRKAMLVEAKKRAATAAKNKARFEAKRVRMDLTYY